MPEPIKWVYWIEEDWGSLKARLLGRLGIPSLSIQRTSDNLLTGYLASHPGYGKRFYPGFYQTEAEAEKELRKKYAIRLPYFWLILVCLLTWDLTLLRYRRSWEADWTSLQKL